ncbi:MAG: 23S rRNA (uracil(1939)-C(5))-methyltransferase RlmD [Simkaniaceae bacterium]|nr:23S rRNA (uracil(1939)-C(5))-methyltransferase RlmD [Simkaniaceae bacterium]
MEIDIRDLGSHGEGVGDHGGKVIFVEGALPGESVEIDLTVEKKSYSKGDLTKVLKPSEERIEPPCPYFERCGGCSIQHLSYEGSLELKRNHVEQTLRRVGKLEITVEKTEPSDKKFGYRNKIVLPVQGAVGLYAKGSHEIIPIDHCMIHNEVGERVFKLALGLELSSLRHLLIRTSINSGKVLVGLITRGKLDKALAKAFAECEEVEGVLHAVNKRDDNVILSSGFTLIHGSDYIVEKLCGLFFRMRAGSFFQVNPWQAQKLYETALDWAELKKGDRVIDAYCGVGTMALIFASRGAEVRGIEIVPEAIRAAKENGEDNGIEASFICGRAEKLLPKEKRADVVILNPPRKGCELAVLDAIAKKRPRRVLYVSCHPATLARDLAHLVDRGYSIARVKPFDMFPQTMHVETLVRLDLMDNALLATEGLANSKD